MHPPKTGFDLASKPKENPKRLFLSISGLDRSFSL
jgi:hypothetical protein